MDFPFICSNISAAPAYGIHFSKLIRYSGTCGAYHNSLDRELLLTRKLLKPGFLLAKLRSSLRDFMIATMIWLTVMEYMCHQWSQICSTCRKYSPVYSSLMTYHRTRLTRRMPLVEQELISLPENLSSAPVFNVVRVTRSLSWCVYFVYRCLSFCTFSFGHCVVCSSIYGYDCPFGIVKLFFMGNWWATVHV